MGEELGYEEQMPCKKQHRVPELSPFAAGHRKKVRERLDTQISEIKIIARPSGTHIVKS